MTFEEFFDVYKPIENHIDNNASFEGVMFETFGEELEYVLSADPKCVVTYADGDNGTYIFSGYHLVNRIGYFITSIPVEEDLCIEVSNDNEEVIMDYVNGSKAEYEALEGEILSGVVTEKVAVNALDKLINENEIDAFIDTLKSIRSVVANESEIFTFIFRAIKSRIAMGAFRIGGVNAGLMVRSKDELVEFIEFVRRALDIASMSAFASPIASEVSNKVIEDLEVLVEAGGGKTKAQSLERIRNRCDYDDEGFPILYRVSDNSETTICPFCGGTHLHGGGDGHRVAHCYDKKVEYINNGRIVKCSKGYSVITDRSSALNKPNNYSEEVYKDS